MKIIISENQGMCFGVRRALEIAQSQAKTFTYGPIVHNSDVIDFLEKKGVGVKDSIGKIDSGDTIIIRTHGISDKEFDQIKEKGANIVDATCPFVSKAKQSAKSLEENGFQVVILGQKDHPEVKGIAQSLRSSIIIADENDIPELIGQKIGLISQTTQSEEVFNSVYGQLKNKGYEVNAKNTICNATLDRQKAAKDTANKSDIMIVIGGKDSSNTKKLAKLCSAITETKHIEKASELNKEWFAGKKSVGVTAGASTPDWIVDEVIEKLKES